MAPDGMRRRERMQKRCKIVREGQFQRRQLTCLLSEFVTLTRLRQSTFLLLMSRDSRFGLALAGSRTFFSSSVPSHPTLLPLAKVICITRLGRERRYPREGCFNILCNLDSNTNLFMGVHVSMSMAGKLHSLCGFHGAVMSKIVLCRDQRMCSLLRLHAPQSKGTSQQRP
ncbi:hypothetical protein BDR03DRAFT_448952 [Suillus americanus]|nr:hypothetical protein BDR03DRAFT_448952 [Suillus americanus]